MADAKQQKIEYTADAGGAIGEIDRLKAAMRSVSDTTARVHVIVDDDKLSGWTRSLDGASGAADRAMGAHDRFGRSADRAGGSARASGEQVRESARAHDDLDRSAARSSDSVDGFSASADRSTQSMSRWGSEVDGLGGGVGNAVSRMNQMQASTERVAAAQQRAAEATASYDQAYADAFKNAPKGSVADRKAHATQATSGERAAMNEATVGAQKAEQSHRNLRDGFKEVDRESRNAEKGVRGLTDGLGGASEGAGAASRGLGGFLSAASSGINVMSSGAGIATSFGQAMAYSAAGSGVLTAGVGAMGAVGVGALGAVGVAAGMAGKEMTDFTLDAHKDSKRFGDSFKQMGKMAHLGAQYISEPMAESLEGLGRSLVTADNHLTNRGMNIAQGLRGGFQNVSTAINQNAEQIGQAGEIAAAGFTNITGLAGPGMSSFLHELPSLTRGAVDGMSQIAAEFGKSGGAIEGATPAINRMVGSLGGLGAEAVHVGAQNLAPFAEDVGSMARGATTMMKDLEGAVRPSMSAFTDTANAAMGGIGSLGDEVTAFAKKVSAGAPGLQSIVSSVGEGMLSAGGSFVDGFTSPKSQAAFANMAKTIADNGPGITGTVEKLTTAIADLTSLGADTVSAFDTVDNIFQAPKKATGGKGVMGALWDKFGATHDESGKMTGWGPSALGGPNRDGLGYNEGWGESLNGGPDRSTLGYQGGAQPGSLAAKIMDATGFDPGTGKYDGNFGGGGSSSSFTAPDWVPTGPAGVAGEGIGGVPGMYSGGGVMWEKDSSGQMVPINSKGKRVSKEQMAGVDRFEKYLKTPGLSGEQKEYAKSSQGDILRGQLSPSWRTPQDPAGTMSAGWAAAHPEEFAQRNPGRQLPKDPHELNQTYPFIPGDPTSGQTGRPGERTGMGPNALPGTLPPPPPSPGTIAGQAQAQSNFNAMTGGQNRQPLGMAGLINPKQANADGQAFGQSLSQGAQQGINRGAGGPAGAAANMAGGTTKAAKKKTETASPSRVFYRWGTSLTDGATNAINDGAPKVTSASAGMGQGTVDGFGKAVAPMPSLMAQSLDKASGTLSDRGLPAGYVWGQNLIDGANTVIKKATLESAGTPSIENTSSREWLAAMGYLGVGAGAAVDRSQPVSFGPQTVNLTLSVPVQVGNGAFEQTVRTVALPLVDGAFVEMEDALVGSRG